MRDRRAFLLSLTGAAALPLARAFAAAPQAMPQANLLPGTPPILDFGDGLKIPMGREAFRTLWEDKDFWLTYGAGSSSYSVKAMGSAEDSAIGTMKLLLLTLAFAPERLDHINGCGWRLKGTNSKNYVLGDISLPGKPYRPIFTGDENNAMSSSGVSGNNTSVDEGPTGVGALGTAGSHASMMGSFNHEHAFTGYLVFKQDVTLDYVRAHAQLL